MRHEYAVHAGVYEDTWHDYETHKRRKIWRADVRGKRKEGFAWLQIRRLRKRQRGSQGMGCSSEGGLGAQ